MRREIFVYLDQNYGTGLKELVLTALRNHRNEIDPYQILSIVLMK